MLRAAVRYARNLLLVAILIAAAAYAGDFLSVKFPGPRDPFGTVQTKPYYAVRKKNKTTEFMFLEPQTEVCVHSLFPHFGDRPCWYVERKNRDRIDM